MEWLDLNSHPRLLLDGEGIELAYQPVSLDHGGGPILGTFKVRCDVRHSTGRFVYVADDVTIEPCVFREFACDLKQVLDGKAREAILAPVGNELVVTVNRMAKNVQMRVTVTEWQGPFDPETTLSAGCSNLNTDRTYRWVSDLKSYGHLMDKWVSATWTT